MLLITLHSLYYLVNDITQLCYKQQITKLPPTYTVTNNKIPL